MQKMWAIAAITLVGLMMIISSIPQDAFAGKNEVKLSLNVVDGDGKVKNALCITIDSSPVFHSRVDNSGNSAKVSFTFPDNTKSVTVTCEYDGGTGDELAGAERTFKLDEKHTRDTYVF